MGPRTDRKLRRQMLKFAIALAVSVFIFYAIFVSSDQDTFLQNGKRLAYYRDFDGNLSPEAFEIGRTNSRPNDSEINLVVVVCDGNQKSAFEEALTMIKSATMFSRKIITVHIFTNQFHSHFKNEFSTWPNLFRMRFKVKYRSVEYPLPNADKQELENWWAPCASMRLFLPEVLKDLDSVLYVDCDVLFLTPAEQIWDYLSKFSPAQVGALTPRVGWQFNVPDDNSHYIKKQDGTKTQVNSGVFLMNLTRMRQERFSTDPQLSMKKLPWSKELILPLYYKYKKEMFGDQDLINIIFHYNPDLIHLLPCKYNYQHKFCFDKFEERWCKSAEQEGAALIHGTAKSFHNGYAPAFKAVYEGLKNYNWEENMHEKLLNQIKQNLNEKSVMQHLHCGNKTELFIRHLRSSIENIK